MNSWLAALPYAAPVLAAASGEVVSERAGIVGIHTEGMMLSAAFASFFVADRTGSALLGLLAGIGAALVLAGVFAFFVVKLAQDAVVVGTAANLLALGLTGAAFRVAYGDTGRLLSVAKLPPVSLVGLVAAIVVIAWVLARSRYGLAIRAVGEAPSAVRAAGFSVLGLRTSALAIAALFSGFGGAFLALGIAGSFAPDTTGGRGFEAIALVAFGRWRPGFVALGALLIGFVEAAQYRLQSTGVPSQLLLMTPYLATLLVLVLAKPGVGAPQALGRAYEEGKA